MRKFLKGVAFWLYIEPNEWESLLIFKLSNQDEKIKLHYMLEAY